MLIGSGIPFTEGMNDITCEYQEPDMVLVC